MKRYIIIIAFWVMSIYSFRTYGQTIVTKNDSIAVEQDSVIKIILQEARGNIQWQKSLNSTNWYNLENETTDTLLIKPEIEAIYRAVVTDGTCLPAISDSVGVVTYDTINTNYINPNYLGLELISDSSELSNGKYTYTGNDNTNEFEVGKVIFDEQSGGTIRIITDIIQNGDTINFQTEQATMEDLFYDANFKLSTEMIYPSNDLKSASISEISKLLTDQDGFIHPVEVIYKSTDGKILKSASIFNERGGIPESQLTIGLTGLKFFEKTFKDQDTKISGNAKAYISDGYFTFNPTFKFEFKYVPAYVESWWPLKINSGYLDKFKFYSDKSLVDFKSILTLESEVKYNYEWEQTLIDNAIQASYNFAIGPVPVIIDIEIDLNCNLNIEVGGKCTISRGFQNTNYVTAGVGYENKNWYTIKNNTKTTQYFADNKGSVHADFKFDIGPEATVKFYKILGPTLYVGPYLEYGINISSKLNWDQNLDLGVTGKIGGEVEILGKKLFPLPEFEWDFFKKINLWSAPNKLSIVSGDNQVAFSGNKLQNPIIFKVTDKWDIPNPAVKVYFEPMAGSVTKNIVTTDINGLASTEWILPADSDGSQIMKVYLLNGSDEEISGCVLYVFAITTPIRIPNISTEAVTNITHTSALSGGNILYDGGGSITARGICWNTIGTPTINDSKTSDGKGSGSFASFITGLTSNTNYYLRAYATNSAGTAYGQVLFFRTEQNLPTLRTETVTNVTQTTATSGGNITNQGISTITARGVCWSATHEPTINDSKTTDGTGTGSFTSNITGLKSYTNYYLRAYATNSEGTAYGQVVFFTTEYENWPTISTDAVTNVTKTTVISGGNISDDGGAAITARGICWSTTGTPTINDSKTTEGTGSGSFTSNITGLTSLTLYYLRAYATNSVGTAYGQTEVFITERPNLPTIGTEVVTNIAQTTATSGGNITDDGGGAITARGVCWNTFGTPTVNDSKTTDGIGSGSFTSNITGLTSSTTYYVRAYATNKAGTAYGQVLSFETEQNIPTLSSEVVTNITQTTATSGGNITNEGITSLTARGVCWNTNGAPTINDSKTTDGTGSGSFTSNITGLTSSTIYYMRAYATNSAGTAYGQIIQFTTAEIHLPYISTEAVTNITKTTASSGGNITDDGGAAITARGVCWVSYEANHSPTIADNTTIDGTGSGSFTSNITGLASNNMYYLRAYATNSAGTAYGLQQTFNTLMPDLPKISIDLVTNISQTTATINSIISDDGGGAITARGVCWNTTGSPTLDYNKTIDGTGSGSFTSNITGLTSNTTYYVRAYAHNSAGNAYGPEVSFITEKIINLPTLSTVTVTNITQTTATTGGNISNDGGGTITVNGVCWNTTGTPTVDDSKTTDGTGSDNFTSNITGLTNSTTYYVRAYATNKAGTAYGQVLSFETSQNIPTLSTATVIDITKTTATSGGNITKEGITAVTARGVCWNTNGTPTTNDNKTTDGTGKGSFNSNITGLTSNTTYYLRAYATNTTGTAYGEEVLFKTIPDICEIVDGSFTDSRDGRSYKTIVINGKEWMAENLAFLPSVQPPNDYSYTEPRYYVFDYKGNDIDEAKATDNYTTYGVLYNWSGAIAACPQGWHIPTDEEWIELENHLIECGYNYDGTTSENKIAKSLATTTYWNESSNTGAIGKEISLNNRSGFSGLPSGLCSDDVFNDIGYSTRWWSSTYQESTSGYDEAWFRELLYDRSFLYRETTYTELGCSVRCVKD
jgi:uncharacterized protein (TIGR02145 family)